MSDAIRLLPPMPFDAFPELDPDRLYLEGGDPRFLRGKNGKLQVCVTLEGWEMLRKAFVSVMWWGGNFTAEERRRDLRLQKLHQALTIMDGVFRLPPIEPAAWKTARRALTRATVAGTDEA